MKKGLGWVGLLLLGILMNANTAFATPLSVSVGCASEAHVWYPANSSAKWIANPSGGVAPYTYQWRHRGSSLPSTTQVFNAILYAGNDDSMDYIEITVVVRDHLGYTATGSCTTAVYWHADSGGCWYYGSSGEIIYC